MADEFDNLESQPTGSSQGLDIQGYLNTVEARKREAQQQMDKDRKSTRLNSSHIPLSRMPSSA